MAQVRLLTFLPDETVAQVNIGSHPELLHIHKELSKRRDKRIELATRKRELEVTSANKRRRIDEDATWSWWKVSTLILRHDPRLTIYFSLLETNCSSK